MLALPALLIAPRLSAQSPPSQIGLYGINHVAATVTDLARSVEFYQRLFGTPIQHRQGTNAVVLRVGSGPHSIILRRGPKPAITTMCLSVADFNPDRLVATLEGHGVTRGDAESGAVSPGVMKVQLRRRSADRGGATEGTPEVVFGDPNNLAVQLQDARYCGGAGVRGDVCGRLEPSPKGVMALVDFSHFTVIGGRSDRATAFYRQLFGMGIQAYQGPLPMLAVGRGPAFLVFAGGGGQRPPAAGAGAAAMPAVPPASINHVALTLKGFDPEKVTRMLLDAGLKERAQGAAGVPGPLETYVSWRTTERGGGGPGAPKGTPELYFTDPDGLLLQLQDVSYCGGSGFLGSVCP